MVTILKRPSSSVANDVTTHITHETPKVKIIDPNKLIPTGSTMLNLALSDTPYGGYYLGTLANIIGDKHTGKTFLSLNACADITYQNLFPNYQLIYDDVERRLKIDVAEMFGQRTKERVNIEHTSVVEDWYQKSRAKVAKKEKFMWFLDSLDHISTEEERKKTKVARDYSEKPLLLTQMFTRIWNDLAEAEAFFCIISQTRQNIGVGAMFQPRRRAGGDILGFVATHEVWLGMVERIKRGPQANTKEVGIKVEARVEKNSLTGRRRRVRFDIIRDYGIDDVGSMIDWLLKEGFWSKPANQTKIHCASDVAFLPSSATKDELTEHVDANNLGKQLQGYVGRCWIIAEEKVATNRRRRYE